MNEAERDKDHELWLEEAHRHLEIFHEDFLTPTSIWCRIMTHLLAAMHPRLFRFPRTRAHKALDEHINLLVTAPRPHDKSFIATSEEEQGEEVKARNCHEDRSLKCHSLLHPVHRLLDRLPAHPLFDDRRGNHSPKRKGTEPKVDAERQGLDDVVLSSDCDSGLGTASFRLSHYSTFQRITRHVSIHCRYRILFD